jgi:WhiB family redox-sensing transcriptional regulator
MFGDIEGWDEEAECGKAKNKEIAKNFFSNKPSQQYKALKLCEICPVRKECLRWALDTKQLWGIWGGLNYKQIRRTLSVNWEGQEMRHNRFPLCPYCKSKTNFLNTKTISRPSGGRWATMKMVECSNCLFSWQSRTSANAVDAYHSQEIKKKKS